MKKKILGLIALLFMCVPMVANAESYKVDDNMTIDLDESLWYVFTRDNIKDNSELDELGLTYDYMNDLTEKSLHKYYGDEVELDALSPLSWIRRSHYYMFFYLYAYSICISVASNVASEILKGNKEMLDNYIKFLSTGSDKWPIEAFKILGVDLESEDVYKKAIDYYKSLLDEFDKIRNEE